MKGKFLEACSFKKYVTVINHEEVDSFDRIWDLGSRLRFWAKIVGLMAGPARPAEAGAGCLSGPTGLRYKILKY